MLIELSNLFSVTHVNHAGTVKGKHPPTQLDLSLIVEEDVGTLEEEEEEGGKTIINRDTNTETSYLTETLLYPHTDL